jgi:hypothetical protein
LSSQSAKPVAQTMPHVVPLQVVVEFGPLGQGEHAAPHVAASVLFAQAPPHT